MKGSGQKGNVFVGSLVFLAMSLGFMIMVPQIQQSGIVQIKAARARAVMNTQEMKIRAVLLEQSTYQNCSAATRSQCALNPQKMAPFQFVHVPGCAGQPSASCGVQLMSVNFNNSNLTFTGTLHYSGNDVAIHDSVINFSLPPEVLQDKQISCPSGSPFFSGFASDGSVVCNAFPNDCGPGKYASGFQISTLQPICQDLPSTVTCAANEILTSYEWLGGTTGLSTKCQTRDRSSAESMFQFSPQYVPAGIFVAPLPVNCQGAWGACTGTCGTGTQTYVITTPSANGGLACPVANGATQSCSLSACCTPSVSVTYSACSSGYSGQIKTTTTVTCPGMVSSSVVDNSGCTRVNSCPASIIINWDNAGLAPLKSVTPFALGSGHDWCYYEVFNRDHYCATYDATVGQKIAEAKCCLGNPTKGLLGGDCNQSYACERMSLDCPGGSTGNSYSYAYTRTGMGRFRYNAGIETWSCNINGGTYGCSFEVCNQNQRNQCFGSGVVMTNARQQVTGRNRFGPIYSNFWDCQSPTIGTVTCHD